jgi:NADH-quinone oxidoreductase subunit N
MFKLSVPPFHMWTPDVYEGSPIMSVSIFASVHKISAIAVFVNLISLAIGKFGYEFMPIIKILAVASLLVGSLGAIFQTSIKRLMAYSAILNIGYILLAIIASISLGIWRHTFFTYIVIYSVSVIALFSLLAATFGTKADDLTLDDIAGLGKTKKPPLGQLH